MKPAHLLGALAVCIMLWPVDAVARSTTPAYPAATNVAHARGGAPRAAGSYQSSLHVLVIEDADTPGAGGDLQTSGTVIGDDRESFDDFQFDFVDVSDFDPSQLAGYDTVVLDQVLTDHLADAAKKALSSFVTSGNKLIIHDSDGTDGNDYAWLPAPARTGRSCPDCGDKSGEALVVENNAMVSDQSSDASYVDVAELPGATDAVGDSNVMVTQDGNWYVDITATNGVGDTGAVHTYATVTGLIIFDGFDTDYMGDSEDSGVDWLSKLWFLELKQQWNPDGLPHLNPVACSAAIGAVTPTTAATPRALHPGTTLTITGSHFCKGTRVRMGNGLATEVATVPNPDSMTVNLSRLATTGPIQLVAPDGTVGAPGPVVTVDNYRNTDGFAFTNFRGITDLTFDDIAAAFGDDVWVTWPLCPLCGGTAVQTITGAARDVYDEAKDLSGLCFGFAFGTLRLSQGRDPLNATADKRRSDTAWNVANVLGLPMPAFEDPSGPAPDKRSYDAQMRHYLYRAAISQYSTELTNAEHTYTTGLRQAKDRVGYLRNQIEAGLPNGLSLVQITQRYYDKAKASLWSKLFDLHGANASDGHALVGYDLEDDGDGGFYIDVYDPNWPYTADEDTDASKHSDMLRDRRVHVDAGGHWTYDMGFDSEAGRVWGGDLDTIVPVAFGLINGQLHPLASSGSSNLVLTGAAVGQVTDQQGRDLYDSSGALTPLDQRPEVTLLGVPDATPGQGHHPEPMLLLDPATAYTEQIGPGPQQIYGSGVNGSITSASGATVVLANAGTSLQLTPRRPGDVTMQVTRRDGDQQIDTTVKGLTGGSVGITVSGSLTVSTLAPGKLSVVVKRTGGTKPPSVFRSKALKLAGGSRLLLAGISKAPSRSKLRVTITRRGHHRHLTIRNISHRPRLRVKVRVRQKRAHTIVTVRPSLRPGKGVSFVAVRAHRRTSRVRRIAAARHRSVSFVLGRQRHGTHITVWAVGLTPDGQSSRTVKRSVRVP